MKSKQELVDSGLNNSGQFQTPSSEQVVSTNTNYRLKQGQNQSKPRWSEDIAEQNVQDGLQRHQSQFEKFVLEQIDLNYRMGISSDTVEFLNQKFLQRVSKCNKKVEKLSKANKALQKTRNVRLAVTKQIDKMQKQVLKSIKNRKHLQSEYQELFDKRLAKQQEKNLKYSEYKILERSAIQKVRELMETQGQETLELTLENDNSISQSKIKEIEERSEKFEKIRIETLAEAEEWIEQEKHKEGSSQSIAARTQTLNLRKKLSLIKHRIQDKRAALSRKVQEHERVKENICGITEEIKVLEEKQYQQQIQLDSIQEQRDSIQSDLLAQSKKQQYAKQLSQELLECQDRVSNAEAQVRDLMVFFKNLGQEESELEERLMVLKRANRPVESQKFQSLKRRSFQSQSQKITQNGRKEYLQREKKEGRVQELFDYYDRFRGAM